MIQSSKEHDSSFTKNSPQNSSADASTQIPKVSAANFNAATFAFATQVVIDCGVPQMLQFPGIDHDEHNLSYESGARIDKVMVKPVPAPSAGPPANFGTMLSNDVGSSLASRPAKRVAKRTLDCIAPIEDSKALLWKQRLMAKRDGLTSNDSTAADSTDIPVTKPDVEEATQSEEVPQPLANMFASPSLKRTPPPTGDVAKEATLQSVFNAARKPSKHNSSLNMDAAKSASNVGTSDAAVLLALAALSGVSETERSVQKVKSRKSKGAGHSRSPLVPDALIFPEASATGGFSEVDFSKTGAERILTKSAERKTKPATSVVVSSATSNATADKLDAPEFSISTSPFSVVEPETQDEECYSDWFRRVVVKNRWATWFTTFYVHWLLLLALTVIIVHGPENAANLLINATMASVEEIETTVFEVDTADPAPVIEPDPTAEPVKVNRFKLEEQEVPLSESVLDKVSPDGDMPAAAESTSSSEAEPKPRERASNPAPATAISEGSFSVWTEPTYPVAGEPYRIIIQVCLPDGIQRYDIADLEGVVVGSDGYRKPIPGSLRGFLPVENGYGRLIIPIVSADATVKDTVYIRSKLLKEAQKLLIEF